MPTLAMQYSAASGEGGRSSSSRRRSGRRWGRRSTEATAIIMTAKTIATTVNKDSLDTLDT